MESSTNFILKVIDFLGMSHIGVFTGSVGAVLSLLFFNGNQLSYRKSIGILLAGVSLCGYTVVYVTTKVATPSLAYIINIAIGYVSSDVLSSIKTKAPTITNRLIDAISERLNPTKNESN